MSESMVCQDARAEIQQKKLNPNSCLMTKCSDRMLSEFYSQHDCLQSQWKDLSSPVYESAP